MQRLLDQNCFGGNVDISRAIIKLSGASLGQQDCGDLCALLRGWCAVDRTAVGGMDNDAHSLLETSATVRSSRANVRRLASLFTLPCGEHGQALGKKIGPSTANLEGRHDLRVSDG